MTIKSNLRRTLKLLSAIMILCITLMILVPVSKAQTGDYGGAQFLAKQYTEALGRAPDAAGYDYYATRLTNDGATLANLEQICTGMFTSQEYNNLGLSSRAKVMTLYRAILNRDPDLAGGNYYLGLLTGGTAISTIINMMINSTEFASFLPTIQNQGPYYWNGSNSFWSVSGTTMTASQLQALLNGTDTVISLAPGTLVTVDTPITIPAGKTLRTGDGTTTPYTMKARLLRTGAFNGAVVIVSSGATLKNVWVDGNRTAYWSGDPAVDSSLAINVSVRGYDCHVEVCRISDPLGGTNLRTEDSASYGRASQRAQIVNNLITGYATSHYMSSQNKGQWADGITIGGRDHYIYNNKIIDCTDVGIVMFRYWDSVLDFKLAQNTIVEANTILNIGNSAYGGINTDCWFGTPGTVWKFDGAQFKNNTFWTSSRAHQHITLSFATRAWFYAGENGTGAAATGNTTPNNLYVRAACGIADDGMFNATMTNNNLSVILGPWHNTGYNSYQMVVNSPACASGTFQTPYSTGALHSTTDAYICTCTGNP